MSLRTKFLLAFVLVALLGVGTVALVANRVIAREFTLYVRTGGQPRAQRLADQAAQVYAQSGSWAGATDELATLLSAGAPGAGPGAGRGQGVQQEQGGGDRALVIDRQGQVVVDTEGELTGQPMPGDYESVGTAITVGETRVGTLLLTTRDLSGHSDLEKRFLDTVNQAVLWAVSLVAVAALVAAAILSRQLVGPLRALTAASEAMAGGDLSQRVGLERADEIGDLGRAFDKMASDLAAARAQRQQMTADIAHELRNPLSVIRGNLEAMIDGIYPTDVEHLGPIYEETLLLQRLVQDLRLLSLADAGELHLVRSEVDLTALLRGIVESVQAVADDQGVEMAVDLPEERLTVQGDVDRLRQVVGNLLSNALRYTPAGGTVALRAARAGDRVTIGVADTGAGIAPVDLPHVFDRFYRADVARDRASGGSGLGLAIVRALVEAHGGQIEVQSALGQGTMFTLSFPASD
ncbi:MAG: HAMP domain-containing protein [Anaerolineae bacterium]|nr:HAMP domain-containing protein [Anaerolineae bacterium]